MEADNNNNRKAIDAHNMNNQPSAMARAKTAKAQRCIETATTEKNDAFKNRKRQQSTVIDGKNNSKQQKHGIAGDA